MKRYFIFFIAIFLSGGVSGEDRKKQQAAEPYYEWKVDNFAINEPIGGKVGDPEKGAKLVLERKKGNCIACHVMPGVDAAFPGQIGPPLTGLASRYTEGMIRLRVVDEKMINPATIMPGYYRHWKHYNNVKKKFRNKTILTAQEVEDVVAFLMTFK